MPKHKRNKKPKPNRKHKDTVFVDLFGRDRDAKKNLLSLYNAIHGTNLPLTTKIDPIRLEQVLYMNLVNDVSCIIDNKIIVLAEHQSTINENMPLRFLEYIARLYEQIHKAEDRYKRKLLKIPYPEFFVFYNGKEEYPPAKTLKLSDAFFIENEKYNLDLIVEVININKDKNNDILQRCKPLEEYSTFVESVRENRAKDREKGFIKAIKECINKDILKDYLTRKSKEVINMLLAEYDYKTDIAVQRAEALEIGMQQGMQKGVYQNKLETAKSLRNMGMEIDKIVTVTGLSKEEIERL